MGKYLLTKEKNSPFSHSSGIQD